MPCGDPFPDNYDPYARVDADKIAKKVDDLEKIVREVASKDRASVKFLQSALCVLMTGISRLRTNNVGVYKQLLDDTNWVEAGITRDDLMDWWASHQAWDTLRRQMEADKAKRSTLLRDGI